MHFASHTAQCIAFFLPQTKMKMVKYKNHKSIYCMFCPTHPLILQKHNKMHEILFYDWFNIPLNIKGFSILNITLTYMYVCNVKPIS